MNPYGGEANPGFADVRQPSEIGTEKRMEVLKASCYYPFGMMR
jgi:hypothetical protein